MSFKCSANATSFIVSRINASRSFYDKINVHLKQIVFHFHFVQKLSLRWLQFKVEHVQGQLPHVRFEWQLYYGADVSAGVYYPVLSSVC